MAQQYKIDKINKIKVYFEDNENYIFNNFTGLNVTQMSELRNKLREQDSKFLVVKNNFAKRVLQENNIEDVGGNLIGATAVAFVKENYNEVLKILFKFEKDTSLEVKGGWINDSLCDVKQLDALSKLPGKTELIAMFMSTLNAPLQNFMYALNDIPGRLVRVLNAVAESKK